MYGNFDIILDHLTPHSSAYGQWQRALSWELGLRWGWGGAGGRNAWPPGGAGGLGRSVGSGLRNCYAPARMYLPLPMQFDQALLGDQACLMLIGAHL